MNNISSIIHYVNPDVTFPKEKDEARQEARATDNKAYEKTVEEFRATLNTHHPSSNPSLIDHFTNLGVVSKILSGDNTHDAPLTAGDRHRQFLQQLATSSTPMNEYSKLQSSGNLSKRACQAILSNPNLEADDDIEAIAIENCIPASYIVAKLMKSHKQNKIISRWMAKVPKANDILQYIHELDHKKTPNPETSIEADDAKRASFLLCEMDLTAHMAYTLRTQGVQQGLKVWKNWTRRYDTKLSFRTRKSVFQLPGLQLLYYGLREPALAPAVIYVVLSRDPHILHAAPPRGFRQNVIAVVVNDALVRKSPSSILRAMQVMDLYRGCLKWDETANFTVRLITAWMTQPEVMATEFLSVRLFLSRSEEECQHADFTVRGNLARVSAMLEEFCRKQRMCGVQAEKWGIIDVRFNERMGRANNQVIKMDS